MIQLFIINIYRPSAMVVIYKELIKVYQSIVKLIFMLIQVLLNTII